MRAQWSLTPAGLQPLHNDAIGGRLTPGVATFLVWKRILQAATQRVHTVSAVTDVVPWRDNGRMPHVA